MSKAQIRLQELKAEMEKGHKQLEMCDRQRRNILDMLLRISGAIQVLEELLCEEGGTESHVAGEANGAAPIASNVG